MAKYSFGSQEDETSATYKINVSKDSGSTLNWGKMSGSSEREVDIHEYTIEQSDQFSDLMNELAELIKKIDERDERIETIIAQAGLLSKEAAKKKPKPTLLKITASGLVEAAKSVAKAYPSLFAVAQKIAMLFV